MKRLYLCRVPSGGKRPFLSEPVQKPYVLSVFQTNKSPLRRNCSNIAVILETDSFGRIELTRERIAAMLISKHPYASARP